MKKVLVTIFVFAMAYTISCTSDNEEGGETSSSSDTSSTPSSSSSNSSSSSSTPSTPSSGSGGGTNQAGCPNASTSEGSMTCGGKTYKTVKIGGQVWIAENLNYAAESSICYDFEESNCDKYGRLYNWATAKTVCPTGWHLPNDAEWLTLKTTAGGEIAGIELKAQTGWDGYDGPDTYGFSALPGGSYDSEGTFYSIGNYALWWSATDSDAFGASYWYIQYNIDYLSTFDYAFKYYFYSVRCIKN